MWELRADRARRDIAAMATAGLGVAQLHAASIRLVEQAVGADLTCWGSVDPETLLIGAMVSGDARIPQEYEHVLAEAEFAPAQPHRFAALAAQGRTLARLSDLPTRERLRSLRYRGVWRPLGLEHELRAVFLVDGTCWGAAGMARSGHDFTERETDFLAAVLPAIASATRAAVRAEIRGRDGGADPAVVVVGADGSVRSATPAAHEWEDRFDVFAQGHFQTVMRAMAAAARVATSGGFQGRLRDGSGHWVVLRASPLVGGEDGQVAVALESAGGDDLVSLQLRAYGLTAREEEVCREVLAGRTSAEIAAHLFISVNTVQDHLKSVFAKVGVRSRGSLVARLSGR
ncbi:MAG: helix-turn-helix transcriptional regulator [Nocardioides sp.]